MEFEDLLQSGILRIANLRVSNSGYRINSAQQERERLQQVLSVNCQRNSEGDESIASREKENNLRLSDMSEFRDKEILLGMLCHLVFLLTVNPVKNFWSKRSRIYNSYWDAILVKYEQTFMQFKKLYPSDELVALFERRLKIVKRRRFLKKYFVVLGLWLILMIAGILIATNVE